MLKWDMTKAFWVQNMVSNFCYFRWSDAYPMVREKIDGIHADFMEQVKIVDDTAVKLYHNQSAEAAVEYVTQYSVLAGRKLHQQWIDFYGELFVRFRDFSTIVPKEDDTRCGCEVQEPGLSEITKRRIVTETGSHYEIPKEGSVDQRLGAPAQETIYKEIY